ncbi:hypothetical protein SLEP1_g56449 [Rubroshorea leprosula]|uniref:Uncharacterized protein n=1 Tax=Rubroshorea leprosula TaxID=152421 RepID=A0AAV5MIT6_9ROSI|nr:hypothetical protein SLEP1_g56449 [Rubroshorea leprosula]
MDRVFSVDEISDHQFWPSPPSPPSSSLPSSTTAAAVADEPSSKINRSSSEWAFQRLIQEVSEAKKVQGENNPELNQSPPKDATGTSCVTEVSTNVKSTSIEKNGGTEAFNGGAPKIPVDSDEYQAFLKNKLNLACAAVALSRVSLHIAQFGSSFVFLFLYFCSLVFTSGLNIDAGKLKGRKFLNLFPFSLLLIFILIISLLLVYCC